MTTFSEDDAREVFARAARAQQAATDGDRDRLTLDELREIGLASGLDPAFVAAAARDIALGAPDVAVRTVGPVPTAVFRSVRLAEAPTDALWEHLVADARRTFGAQGQVSGRGDAREWRNGALRMALAADGDGARLSFQTDRERQVRTRLVLGGVQLATALIVALVSWQTGDPGASGWGLAVLLAVVGAVLTAGTWAQQGLWAAARDAQMEDLAERAAARTAVPASVPAAVETPSATDAPPLRDAFEALDEPDEPDERDRSDRPASSRTRRTRS